MDATVLRRQLIAAVYKRRLRAPADGRAVCCYYCGARYDLRLGLCPECMSPPR